MIETCYMCDEVATTREHAPAKCLFPEEKDTNDGINYRKNLITVPSCDTHNTGKSKDDEYFLYLATMTITANDKGAQQFVTKCKRAIERKPNIARKLTNGAFPVKMWDTKTNTYSNGISVKFNRERVEGFLRQTARAIFFYDTKEKFLGKILINADFWIDEADPKQDTTSNIFNMLEKLLKDKPYKGDNPDIFKYRLFQKETDHPSLLEMIFYGSNRVIAYMPAYEN